MSDRDAHSRGWLIAIVRRLVAQRLSAGMFAAAMCVFAVSLGSDGFARQPELLILDEPSEGLDPGGIEELLEILVARCSEGTTVFFSSHQIAEVERIADQICILHAGRLVLDSSVDDLRESYRRIDLIFPSIPAEHDFRIAGIEEVRTRGHQMSVLASRNAEAVVARAHDFHATSIDITPVALRDVFLQKVKES